MLRTAKLRTRRQMLFADCLQWIWVRKPSVAQEFGGAEEGVLVALKIRWEERNKCRGSLVFSGGYEEKVL